MKRSILVILVFLFYLLFPIKVKALEYIPKLSGQSTIYSDSPNEIPSIFNNISLRIDVSNIENIASFLIKVQYDRDIIMVHNCSTLDFIATSCWVGSNHEILFDYKYPSRNEEILSKYGVFYVNFGARATTPKSGTTTVEVSFQDAKDKEGNDVNINPIEKVYTFKDYSKAFVIEVPSNSNKENSNKNTNIVKPNTDKVANAKSKNKFLKSLEIEGVEFEFDRKKTDYTISVDEDVNKLNIKAIPEDEKATYRIIGADNLSLNKNIVRIEVTAEDKTKQTYYIKVRYDKENTVKEDFSSSIQDSSEEKKNSTTGKKTEKKENILMWIGIGIGAFIGIVLIILIIFKIADCSIDKKLQSLEGD